jgi:hypothetical protein
MKPRADLLERKTPTGVFKICSLCRKDMRADLPRLRERFREHVKLEHPEVVPRRSAAYSRAPKTPANRTAGRCHVAPSMGTLPEQSLSNL